MKKRTLKTWTVQEIDVLKEFFKDISTKTREEKDEFAKKLDRTWACVYNKHWDVSNPGAKSSTQRRSRKNAMIRKEKGTEVDNEKLIITHLKKEISLKSFSIKIGEVVIETDSRKIKVDGVLIEV